MRGGNDFIFVFFDSDLPYFYARFYKTTRLLEHDMINMIKLSHHLRLHNVVL